MKLRNKKTNEIVDVLISAYGISGDVAVSVRDPNMECGYLDLGRYKTLAKLNEEWEDYVPKEPLIKDEKVRKAVRAWARENLIEKVGFKLDRGKTQCACYFYDESCEVCEFGLKFYLDIEHNKVYTIEELCGEEEE